MIGTGGTTSEGIVWIKCGVLFGPKDGDVTACCAITGLWISMGEG